MKIALDISAIVYGTGVSVYTKELVRNLLEIDTKNHYILYAGSLRRRDEIREFLKSLTSHNFSGRVYPIAPTLANLLWNTFHKLPIETLIGSVDVFHSSDWTQPVSSATKITTVHDMVPVLYPEWSDPKIVAAHTKRLKWVKSEVDTIIVPSKQTKLDLMENGFKGKRIVVIPEAVDPSFVKANQAQITTACIKYEIKAPYLLSVGITKRKNTQRIIEAFMELKKDPKYRNFSLVLIGHPYLDLNSTHDVIITGHVDPESLASLMTGASCLVYPSLYEGFGLPILEAMKVSTPVVTSNTGSMRETAGKAAVLVDPTSVFEISNGIKKAIRSTKSFVKKGLLREREFSWKKTAQLTLEVYETTGREDSGK